MLIRVMMMMIMILVVVVVVELACHFGNPLIQIQELLH